MPGLRLLGLTALLAAGCAGYSGVKGGGADSAAAPPAPATAVSPAPAPAAAAKVHKLASGLVYEDLVVGNGKMADPGLSVAVHYTGWLADGTKIDSSLDSGQPYSFTLGQSAVIDGWHQGIKGMRIGGKRRLTIPPDLAYGAEGRPPRVPPNSTLVFEIELLGVR